MTTKRLTILLLIVTLGFSAVFLLPKSAAQPFGIKLELPATLGTWWGTEGSILQKERDTLGKGTEFARKNYKNHFESAAPEILVSIVLSGHDMSNSIHRPERCLDAQGWTRLASDEVQIDVPKMGRFPVTRLQNRTTRRNDDGSTRTINAYSYYWFVGERDITGSHWGRWFIDNRDRLLRGVNQRWAFITVTGIIPSQSDPSRESAARKSTDDAVRGFIKELAPVIHAASLRYD